MEYRSEKILLIRINLHEEFSFVTTVFVVV